jgi:hypothetical protein
VYALGDTCRRKFTTLGIQNTFSNVSFSDSYSFYYYGYPVTYFEEVNQNNPHYHTIHDTLGNCNMKFAAEMTKISMAMLVSQNGTETLVSADERDPMASGYHLYPNYPNPFNPSTTIRYQVAGNSKVSLKIYNTLGQEIRTLVNESQNSGTHQIIWNGRDNQGLSVSSGLYICKLQVGSTVKSNKMLLIK